MNHLFTFQLHLLSVNNMVQELRCCSHLSYKVVFFTGNLKSPKYSTASSNRTGCTSIKGCGVTSGTSLANKNSKINKTQKKSWKKPDKQKHIICKHRIALRR